MKYIYESPDKGKTVYRRPLNCPDEERELITPKTKDINVEVIEGLTISYEE